MKSLIISLVLLITVSMPCLGEEFKLSYDYQLSAEPLELNMSVPNNPIVKERKWDWSWSKQDIILQCVSIGTNIIDWGQTRYISTHPFDYYETNPKLGRNPTLKQVDQHFKNCIILDLLITCILPKIKINQNTKINLKLINQVNTIATEIPCISNNASIGIKVNF